MSLIAVVDNDSQILGLLTDVLEYRGWMVTTYRSGEEAITFLKEDQPDLVLLDLWLESPTSGWHVLRSLKAEPRTRNIPVVLLSEQGDAVRTNDAWLQEHGVEVITKPFDVELLCESVEAALSGRAALVTA
jgi:CheY-like chemotaxis protein